MVVEREARWWMSHTAMRTSGGGQERVVEDRSYRLFFDGRLGVEIAIVAVVGVVIRIAVEPDVYVVEDDPQELGVKLDERFECLLDRLARRLLGADHQDHPAGHRREDGRVGQAEQGRGVD